MDRTWRVNFTSPDAIQAGYSDDLEFVLKELGKTYLAVSTYLAPAVLPCVVPCLRPPSPNRSLRSTHRAAHCRTS
jgi:hypothetical protein